MYSFEKFSICESKTKPIYIHVTCSMGQKTNYFVVKKKKKKAIALLYSVRNLWSQEILAIFFRTQRGGGGWEFFFFGSLNILWRVFRTVNIRLCTFENHRLKLVRFFCGKQTNCCKICYIWKAEAIPEILRVQGLKLNKNSRIYRYVNI